MRLVTLLVFFFVLIGGCAHTGKSYVDNLEARVSSIGGPPYAVGSSVGDWVEYLYQGRFDGPPIIIRKQIMSVACDRMIVEVTVIRQGSRRTWRELVDVIRESRLGLEQEADGVPGVPSNMPFHAWILPGEKVERGVRVTPCRIEVVGKEYSCECRSGRILWRGRKLSFVDPVCPGFTFAHGPARYRDVETGEVVLEVEVLRSGHMFFRARDLD